MPPAWSPCSRRPTRWTRSTTQWTTSMPADCAAAGSWSPPRRRLSRRDDHDQVSAVPRIVGRTHRPWADGSTSWTSSGWRAEAAGRDGGDPAGFRAPLHDHDEWLRAVGDLVLRDVLLRWC